MEKYIAIDNYCGWPFVTKLPDNGLLMTVFNKPYHGIYEGETETFFSSDSGYTWKYQGTPAYHKPGENKMNVACGLANNNDYIVIVSGYEGKKPPPEDRSKYTMDGVKWKRTESLICRSNDNGKTFTAKPLSYIPPNETVNKIKPYGNIISLPGGKLLCPIHSDNFDSGIASTGTSYAVFSEDDGNSWGNAKIIGTGNFNETAVLYVGNGKLLAALRTYNCNERLELFESNDMGENWSYREILTAGGMIPANLIKLDNGGILLTFGIRFGGLLGIGAMLSRDEGKNWSVTKVLNLIEGSRDGGYPSSVQLNDGTIVTAYYTKGCKDHARYHVGTLHWRIDDFF